jgi:hypothetical protein
MKSFQYGALVAMVFFSSTLAKEGHDSTLASPGVELSQILPPVARTEIAQTKTPPIPKGYDWCEDSKYGTFQCPEGQYCYGTGKDQHCARPGGQRFGAQRTGRQKAPK